MSMPSRDKDFISLCLENSRKERNLTRYAGVVPKEEAQQSTRHKQNDGQMSIYTWSWSREVCGHIKQQSGPHKANVNLTTLQKYLKLLRLEGHTPSRGQCPGKSYFLRSWRHTCSLALLCSSPRFKLLSKNKGHRTHAPHACPHSTPRQTAAGDGGPGALWIKTVETLSSGSHSLCYLGQVIHTVGPQFLHLRYWDNNRTSHITPLGRFNGMMPNALLAFIINKVITAIIIFYIT